MRCLKPCLCQTISQSRQSVNARCSLCLPSLQPAAPPVALQDETLTRWCCIHEGSIGVHVVVDRCMYLPGDEVRVKVEVDNQSPRRVEAVQVRASSKGATEQVSLSSDEIACCCCGQAAMGTSRLAPCP